MKYKFTKVMIKSLKRGNDPKPQEEIIVEEKKFMSLFGGS